MNLKPAEIITDASALDIRIAQIAVQHSTAVVITDENVQREILPRLPLTGNLPVIAIPAGEASKTLATATEIWRRFADMSLGRNALVINIGGGMISDLGGFTASLWKRGISFINIPTTLLAMTDAAIGGKTAVDFDGVKNSVGTFALPEAVLVCPEFLDTLPRSEMLSGLGEVYKTALLMKHQDLLGADCNPDIIAECIRFKEDIVRCDPKEGNLRRILNLGHTAGHAFESMLAAKGQPVPHGIAVAHGILIALILSNMKLKMPTELMYRYNSGTLRHLFPPIYFTCQDYDELLRLMRADKKNSSTESFNFVLLNADFEPVPQTKVTPEEVSTALDIYRDLVGI